MRACGLPPQFVEKTLERGDKVLTVVGDDDAHTYRVHAQPVQQTQGEIVVAAAIGHLVADESNEFDAATDLTTRSVSVILLYGYMRRLGPQWRAHLQSFQKFVEAANKTWKPGCRLIDTLGDAFCGPPRE